MVIKEALSEEVPLPWDMNDELAPGGMEFLGQRAEPGCRAQDRQAHGVGEGLKKPGDRKAARMEGPESPGLWRPDKSVRFILGNICGQEEKGCCVRGEWTGMGLAVRWEEARMSFRRSLPSRQGWMVTRR